jgi:tRNA modification GTPase
VRLSGPAAPRIASAILGELPTARCAHFGPFYGDQNHPLDAGIALYFPAPRSYTGEHVLELHGHGGPVVMDMLIARALALGARLARPGEFTERAFLNGKLDLAQAEAVADLIDAGSEAAARSALRSLSGAFSSEVHALVEELTRLRAYIEAALDFPEEEVDFLADKTVTERTAALSDALDRLLAGTRQGCLLKEGMRVAIIGAPNAGKSSLLNALARADRAIVSPVPGTTRDVIEQHVQLDGLPVWLIDTAGLRDSSDPIEREGMRRARAAAEHADCALVVMDDSAPEHREEVLGRIPASIPYVVVRNKIDLTGREPGEAQGEFAISAATGAGLETLRVHLQARMGYRPAGEGTFSARRRHLEALNRARGHLEAGSRHALARDGELLAEELRQAQQVLGAITGEVSSDELLGRIFSEFCIGK